MSHSDTSLLEGRAAASAARLAAEAAFSNVTAAVPATDDRPIVVVRRKKLAVDGAALSGERDHNEAIRPPKVYRIDSGPEAESEDSSAEPGAAGDGAPLGQNACMVVGRRRRHSKHGGVTIVRPAPPTASELAERIRIAEEQYERLMAEIRELDRQIEAAREAEVGKAVRWIRRAIAEYGLEAKDLGLS